MDNSANNDDCEHTLIITTRAPDGAMRSHSVVFENKRLALAAAESHAHGALALVAHLKPYVAPGVVYAVVQSATF